MMKGSAGTVRVLCATIAFGLGMDIPQIGLIVHWDAADSMLDYVQQTGRGGRDGSRCLCVTLYDRAESLRRMSFLSKCIDAQKRAYTVGNLQEVRLGPTLLSLLTTVDHVDCKHHACRC
jgi:ATP-dependent DNA helicase RecQ